MRKATKKVTIKDDLKTKNYSSHFGFVFILLSSEPVPSSGGARGCFLTTFDLVMAAIMANIFKVLFCM